MDHVEMVPVALAASGFEAKVLAARLGADGVVWELRGDVDSVYPVGGIEVLVRSEEVDHARDLLAAAPLPVDSLVDDEDELVVHPPRRTALAVGVAVLLVAFVAVRLLAMG
jgi:hypothetical protein